MSTGSNTGQSSLSSTYFWYILKSWNSFWMRVCLFSSENLWQGLWQILWFSQMFIQMISRKNIIFYLGWIQKVRLPVLWMNHNIWLLLFCPLILFHFQSTIDTLPWCWQNLSSLGSCLLLSLISCHHWDLPGKATDTSTTANSVRQSQWEQREKKVCQKLVCGIKVLILCVNQGEEVLRLLIMPNGSNQP